MLKLQIIFLLNLIFQPAFASILPENNLALPISKKSEGLTEEQYHQIIDKVEDVYRPIIKKLGRKLIIKRLWEDPIVNAGAIRNGREWILKLYGGYARHPLVTEDGYALVICHELGHHLGGAPKKYLQRSDASWPSTEGQADYFATLKCLRKIFDQDDNVAIISKLIIPEAVTTKCSLAFNKDWEKALCIRTSLAGITVANISADIRGSESPDVETPDPTIVNETYEAHPVAQCRLDTYFQGSICEVSSKRSVSDNDEVIATCHPKNGHEIGTRPLCWFKPLE